MSSTSIRIGYSLYELIGKNTDIGTIQKIKETYTQDLHNIPFVQFKGTVISLTK